MMRALVATLSGAVALAIGLAAGSTAASGSSSGTETLTGVVSGAAAANLLNSNSNAPLKFTSLVFSGPVDTSISNVGLGGGNSKTATHTFVTPAGNFTVARTAKSGGQSQPTVTGQSGNTCHFTLNGGTGIYKVVGSKSTGKFAGATGSGTYALTIVASADLTEGKTTCSGNNTGNVVATGASITFKASGPLTLKK
jgi:hypothetical protein